MKNNNIQGNILDIVKREIFQGEIIIENDKIIEIVKKEVKSNNYILPGLIDAHVHIESTMLTPCEFSRLAVKNGTVAVVADPHEIANVCGIKGVEFMLKNAEKTPLKTYIVAPSCVPATKFDIFGKIISSENIEYLFEKYNLKALGEVMDYPAVINGESEILEKIALAKKFNAVVDGHAPGLTLEENLKYANAGISTDHECSNIEEAIDKIKCGMKIQIREGSAAQNFDALSSLITSHNQDVMLCTDDSHPDDLIEIGHINKIVKKAIKNGLNIFDIICAASLNAIKHYKLEVGCLQVGDFADFIIVDNLQDFNILDTYINGKQVFSNGRVLFQTPKVIPINNFITQKISLKDVEIKSENRQIRVIEVIDKELLTEQFITKPLISDGKIISDLNNDILKIVVVNRYEKAKPAVGFINGFGLTAGALASSVSHDSHNIIAVGTDDQSIVNAINELIENKGGLTYVKDKDYYTIPLEIAGLMSTKGAEEIAEIYKELNKIIKINGCKLSSAFMTMAFMSLVVIPKLKINANSLFDVEKFNYVNLFI